MIWRDDDIGAARDLAALCEVDDLLRAAGQIHTVAVVVEPLSYDHALIDCIKSRGMDVQVHAWTHEDLTSDAGAREDLLRAADTLERLFGRRPTVLYPPWNRSNPDVEAAAARAGLTVSAEKVSLEHFIRSEGQPLCPVINFHFWSAEERRLLRSALALLRGVSA